MRISDWSSDVCSSDLLVMPLAEMLEKEPNLTDDDLLERIQQEASRIHQAKVDLVGQEGWAPFERSMLLQSIDTHWRNHLSALAHLRQGIHLRGYAPQDPTPKIGRESVRATGCKN